MKTLSMELKGRILQEIRDYQMLHLDTPSIGYIARSLDIPKSMVQRYLRALDADGVISYAYGKGGKISTPQSDKITSLNGCAAKLDSIIACGQPSLAEEHVEEYVPLPESLFGRGKFYILTAKGDSMIDAGIDSGDLVVVRQQETAEEGKIVVALIDNEEATLKRYYIDHENRRIRLHPENPTMDDMFFDPCRVQIQGVAVKVLKNLA